jgi:biopolymer transport protein ExbD
MASIAARHTLDAHLPDPTSTVQADAVPIVLDVGPRGHYAINDGVVDAAHLGSRLRELYLARPDKRIIVRGARDATYDQVLHAMDVARGAGVTVIGVDTRR